MEHIGNLISTNNYHQSIQKVQKKNTYKTKKVHTGCFGNRPLDLSPLPTTPSFCTVSATVSAAHAITAYKGNVSFILAQEHMLLTDPNLIT